MNDQELMQRIKSEAGALLASTARTCSIPESFFAALTANESGLNFAGGGLAGASQAKRFEPAVLAALVQVVTGHRTAYGSIGADSILASVAGADLFAMGLTINTNAGFRASLKDCLDELIGLASSWGILQIMGYEEIPFRLDDVSKLTEPETSLSVAVQMLNQFAYHNQLDVRKDFAPMFDCWNTGRPHAATADPAYIPNGLARMKLYEALPNA